MLSSALDHEYGEASDPKSEIEESIAIVSISGPLEHHAGWWWDSYDSIVERLEQAFADESTRAVVMRIDSPGGEAAGTVEANRQIVRLKEKYKKPLYAYSDESMYSAAYALGCAADEIWLPSTGGVGSVGCIGVAMDRTAQNRMMGLNIKLLTTGEHKADTHPDRELTPEVEKSLQSKVDFLGTEFMNIVAECRHIAQKDLKKMGAACFLGAEAVRAGLADKVGGWYEFLTHVTEQLESTSAAEEIPSMKTKAKLTKERDALNAKIAASKSPKERKELLVKLNAVAIELASLTAKPKVAASVRSEEEPDEDDVEEEEESEEEDDEDAPESSESEEEEEEEAAASVASMGRQGLERMLSACSKITGKRGASAILGALEALSERPAAQAQTEKRLHRLESEQTRSKVRGMLDVAQREGRITEAEYKSLESAGMKNSVWLKSYLGAKPKIVRTIEDGALQGDPSKTKSATVPAFESMTLDQQKVVTGAAQAAGVPVEKFLEQMAQVNGAPTTAPHI